MKNKNLFKTVLFLTMIIGSVSCTESLKVTSDYNKTTDFTKFKTFTVYQLVTTPNVNQFNAERIVNAIRNEMIKKGFRENNSNPDLVVNAVTVIKNRQSIEARSSAQWYIPNRNVDIKTNQYKEGTLVIDMFDLKERNLIWEGSAYSEIEKQVKNPEKTINEVVSRIFAGFPVTGKNTDHSTM